MACALVWALEWEGLGSRVGVGRFGLTDWCGKVWAHQLGWEGLDSLVGVGRSKEWPVCFLGGLSTSILTTPQQFALCLFCCYVNKLPVYDTASIEMTIC